MLRPCAILGVLLWGSGAAATASATPVDLGWLEGNWLACNGGSSVEERWAGPVADTLVGLNLSARGGRAGWEFMRISRDADGTWAYHALPRGATAPTRFALARAEASRVVFENAAHDFPQRIVYRRDGDRLVARIEGRLGDREASEEWTFARARDGQTCQSPGPRDDRLP